MFAVEVDNLRKEFFRRDATRTRLRKRRRRVAALEGVTFTNPTDEPVRLLAFSTLPNPEVVLYPELGKVGVTTRHPFAPVPEGADKGVVAMFDVPEEK